ncbi:MAG: hypothetical protein QXT45_05380 [Candidatus Bilamarchaeaceae archaeon]
MPFVQKYTIEHLQRTANKYFFLSEWRKNHRKEYSVASQRRLIKKLSSNMISKLSDWRKYSDEELLFVDWVKVLREDQKKRDIHPSPINIVKIVRTVLSWHGVIDSKVSAKKRGSTKKKDFKEFQEDSVVLPVGLTHILNKDSLRAKVIDSRKKE